MLRTSNKKVVVGMSGGVDSSVTAWLLKQQGYEVLGIFMKNWNDVDSLYCTSRQDFLDAASVADNIGIEFDSVNFTNEYFDRVFKDFLSEYSIGRTPNPDVLCNSTIKFRAFLDYAIGIGADNIATGHYARIMSGYNSAINKIEYKLLKAIDKTKDQSYFLCNLNQYQLSKSIFPIGELTKKQVRNIASEIGLHNAVKKDSTGLCFIGERPFKTFLNNYIPTKKGIILDIDGNKIGYHNGISFYTIGQRKGLGIGGNKKYNNSAWYVAKKDVDNNIIYAVQGRDHPYLFSTKLTANNANWISGNIPKNGTYTAKNRYRHKDMPCDLLIKDEYTFVLNFKEPQWAITPGQYAVIYDGMTCLGGGIII